VIRVNGNQRQDMIVSFIQDWIKRSGSGKTLQTLELQIYVQDIEKDVKIYKFFRLFLVLKRYK